MGKRLQIQALTAQERAAVEQVARSRTAQARQVERAKVVLAALRVRVRRDCPALWLEAPTAYLWLHRFETQGLAGLADKPRGR